MRSGSRVADRNRSSSHDVSSSGSAAPFATEVAIQQVARHCAGKGHATAGLEQDDTRVHRLVERKRCTQAATVRGGPVQPHEVRIQNVEDCSVARAEITAAAIEEELLRM